MQTSNSTAPGSQYEKDSKLLLSAKALSSVPGVFFFFAQPPRKGTAPGPGRYITARSDRGDARTVPTLFAQCVEHGLAPATAQAHPSPGRAPHTAPRLSRESRTGESGDACPGRSARTSQAPRRSPPPAAGQRTQRLHHSGRARARLIRAPSRPFAPELERSPTASTQPARSPHPRPPEVSARQAPGRRAAGSGPGAERRRGRNRPRAQRAFPFLGPRGLPAARPHATQHRATETGRSRQRYSPKTARDGNQEAKAERRRSPKLTRRPSWVRSSATGGGGVAAEQPAAGGGAAREQRGGQERWPRPGGAARSRSREVGRPSRAAWSAERTARDGLLGSGAWAGELRAPQPGGCQRGGAPARPELCGKGTGGPSCCEKVVTTPKVGRISAS